MFRIETKYYSPKGGWSEWSGDFDQTVFSKEEDASEMIEKIRVENGPDFLYRVVLDLANMTIVVYEEQLTVY